MFYTKLRGAAQAPKLVAEIVVGALADALGLSVPARVLIEISAISPLTIHTQSWHSCCAIASVGISVSSGCPAYKLRPDGRVARRFGSRVEDRLARWAGPEPGPHGEEPQLALVPRSVVAD